MVGFLKPIGWNNTFEFVIPDSKCLFETINAFLETTDMDGMIKVFEVGWLVCIDLLV